MKRITALLLALALLACAAPALAEGAISVAQQNFCVVPVGSSIYGYLFLKLENNGDAPVKLDGGQLDILDPDGNLLASTTTLWRYAEYLQPGEYTYGYFYQKIDGVETAEQVGNYNVTVNMRESADYVSFRLPAESVFEDDITEGYWTHDYVTTTVTNDVDQIAFDVSIVRALLDASGNILYIDSDSMYNYKGIMPGSAIVLRRQLNNNIEDYLAEKGIQPVSVDAIAYMNVKDPAAFTRGGVAPATEGGEATDAPAEPAATEAAYATLQKGSKGEEVRALQKRLKELGYLKGSADGDFGKGTAKAVTAFQEKAGLPANGVADDATQRALFADNAPGA